MSRHRTRSEIVIEPHAHHWLVETPNGPQSDATCTLCGATRVLSNVYLRDRAGAGWGGHPGEASR